MNKKKIKDLIMAYLNGALSQEKKAEIKKMLRKEGYNLNRLNEYDNILSDLELFTVPEPKEKMHEGFLSLLEESKRDIRRNELHLKNRRGWGRSIFQAGFPRKFAYGLSLLVIGWIIGHWFTPGIGYQNQVRALSSEVKDMKKVLMLTMLEQPSASKRMKAVNTTYEFEDVDEKIVNALLETLNNDTNVNVRLITVETLSNFTYNAKVRAGLIHSIIKQDSPLVQLALADIMLKLHEKRSIKYFRQLLKKKDLDFTVKRRLEQTLKKLI